MTIQTHLAARPVPNPGAATLAEGGRVVQTRPPTRRLGATIKPNPNCNP